MTPLELLSHRAFAAGRASLPRLANLSPDDSIPLRAFAEVPMLGYAYGVGVNGRPKPGQSRSGVPRTAACPWSDFAESVARYAEVVVGPEKSDKLSKSAYVLAGELRTQHRPPSGVPALGREQRRDDSAVATLTMLVLDCDSPASSLGLCSALADLHLAYCVAPTWGSDVDRPKWRLFLPTAPERVDGSERGRAALRLRYAWLAGLLAGLGGLPEACPACSPRAKTAPPRAHHQAACSACRGSGVFRFDLSCWNPSRLHFLGGLRSTDQSRLGRDVRWGKGFAVDCQAWLAGSGWPEFWAAAVDELGLDRPVVQLDRDEDADPGLHDDPTLAAAIGSCRATLLERVRRALAYVGSPAFPAAVVGHGGEGQVMRAASAVVSGFLVPEEHMGERWARRVLDVAYAPRCSQAWDDKWIDRKVAQVRAVPGREPGALLRQGSATGGRFYLSEKGLPGGARGEPLSVGRDELRLWVDAARLCPVDPYDPLDPPAGWEPRQMAGKRRLR